MRVTCESVAEFLQALAAEPGVHDNTVRFSKVVRNADGPGRDRVKWDVLVQVSAVVIDREGGQYLLEAGEACGRDYTDGSNEKKGSEAAEGLRSMVESYCKSREWRLLPGMIGI